jgi:hypothetical protein
MVLLSYTNHRGATQREGGAAQSILRELEKLSVYNQREIVNVPNSAISQGILIKQTDAPAR